MDKSQILKDIESKISDFQFGSLKQNTLNLFSTLGYDSPKKLDLSENTPNGFREFLKDNNKTINKEQAFISDWKSVNFCLQLTHEESFLFESDVNNLYSAKNSYLLFCIELNKDHYPNRVLADITRAMNRLFPQPVFLLLKHGNSLTLSIIDRRKHKKDSSKDVLEKVTLIKDINISTPHRAHLEILFDLSLSELKRKSIIRDFDYLHLAWQSVLNISELNRRFYQEISDWYFWAREKVEFPNKPVKLNTENDSDYDQRVLSFNSMNLIRLITRLIFVWFLKEKGLIRDDLFSEEKLKGLLIFNDNNKSTYYKAILQNLFFATLNQEMNTPQNSDNRKFRNENQNYNITNLYRYKSYFKDDKQALELFAGIPFLNGGLFECLDKRVKNSSGEEEIIRIDGFSDRPDNPLKVPDELFFSEPSNIDLSKVYESKNKNHKVRGIINILNNYKFTVAENTPVEEEVALDPELLGKVFENLLASYNPETGTTSRKQTGSFYTPREIVNYMVDESLIAYIGTRLKDNNITSIDEAKLRNLVSYSEEIPEFSSSEADAILEVLDNSKILDPACGSGAFPMGMLHKMVLIIHKLDPNNDKWKNRQIEKQTQEIRQDIDYAERIKDNVAREKALTELNEKKKNIDDIFANNELDYGRKLFLIENCIYGVDIQPIAVQITKLRFFISLIVDQKVNRAKYNKGIIPLPNLETKFVAANTLIGIKKQDWSLFREDINTKEKELGEIRKKYFTARTPATKLKYREEEEKKRKEIESIFKQAGMGNEEASQLAKWNPYDQNASADWFDMEWMFGIKDGFDIVIGNPPYVRADSPDIAELRKIIMSSNQYQTLWERWDLYVAFIEKSFQLLTIKGFVEFIISDAFIASKYAEKPHQYYLENSLINRINFLSEIKVFEAAVRNIIIEIKKDKNENHIPQRFKHVDFFENKIELPTKKQIELSENTFKIEISNSIVDNFQKCLDWGNICYVSYGLRPNSDERFWQGEFKKEDLIFDVKDDIHSKAYVEGKWIKKYEIKTIKYLEWDTDRSPAKLVRPTFPELYIPNKIMFGRMTGAIYDSGKLLCNNSIIVNVLWKDLKDVFNLSINNSIRKDFEIKGDKLGLLKFRKELESNSEKFDLKYMLAILNSKFGYYYLNSFRRSQISFYPDDLKKLPIKEISKYEQNTFVKIVDNIMDKKKKNIETSKEEKEIDQLVYKLYELSYDEVKIVDPEFGMSREEYDNFEVEG